MKRFNLANGYTNMESHLLTIHGEQYAKFVDEYIRTNPASNKISKYLTTPKVDHPTIIHGWLQLIVMGDFPFSVVENEYLREMSKLPPLSRSSVMRYLTLTHIYLLDRLGSIIPNKFGVIFDGLDSIS
jgi:hypothetical protein